MPRNIRYLVLVESILRIRHIPCVLIRILQSARHQQSSHRNHGQFRFHVYSLDVYLTQIQHRPSELLSFRISHNLVVYRIVIDISLQVEIAHQSPIPLVVVAQSAIILQGGFRFQLRIADVCIIKVVERRHAETLLGIQTYGEFARCKRIDVHKQGGRIFHLRLGRQSILHMVFHRRHQHRTLHFHPVQIQGRS